MSDPIRTPKDYDAFYAARTPEDWPANMAESSRRTIDMLTQAAAGTLQPERFSSYDMSTRVNQANLPDDLSLAVTFQTADTIVALMQRLGTISNYLTDLGRTNIVGLHKTNAVAVLFLAAYRMAAEQGAFDEKAHAEAKDLVEGTREAAKAVVLAEVQRVQAKQQAKRMEIEDLLRALSGLGGAGVDVVMMEKDGTVSPMTPTSTDIPDPDEMDPTKKPH